MNEADPSPTASTGGRSAGSPRRRTWSALPMAVIGVAAIAATAAMAGVDAETGGAPFAGYFHRVATFDVTTNGSVSATQLTASADGDLLAYTDPTARHIGLVDLTSPGTPGAAGVLATDGLPTDVVIRENLLVAAVDESVPGVAAGSLRMFDLQTRNLRGTIDLRGEPSSVDADQQGRWLVAVVSNGDTAQSGRVVVATATDDGDWLVEDVELAAAIELSDPEPAEVAVNEAGFAAVSFPASNRVAMIDLSRGEVVEHFDAGTVQLESVDVVEEELGPRLRGDITLDGSTLVAREPGALAWTTDNSILAAGEGAGDRGGSRGITIFSDNGTVVWDSGAALEHVAASLGRSPEHRAGDRGVEPEAVATGSFRGDDFIAVALSRANLVVTYGIVGGRVSEHQVIETGDRPSGIAMIPERDLMAIAAQGSDRGDYPAMITIHEHRVGSPIAAQLRSAPTAPGTGPVPWGALSGLAVDPDDPTRMAAVSDARYASSAIYTLRVLPVDPDLTTQPGGPVTVANRVEVQQRTRIVDSDGKPRYDLDVEGISLTPDGRAWLISEGAAHLGLVPTVLEIGAGGAVRQEIPVPDLVQPGLDESIGHEGVAVDLDRGTAFVVSQAPAEGDPAAHVRIWRLDIAAGTWASILYPLDAMPLERSKSGLSDITKLDDGRYAVIERDAYAGPLATVKRIYRVHLADPTLTWTPWGTADVPAVVTKRLIADVLDELTESSVWTPDKPEGLAALPDGDFWLVTDNDGVNDALGETILLRVEDET